MRNVVLILVLMSFSLVGFSQQKLDLPAQRHAAEAEIARIDAELKGINSSQKSAQNRLKLIRSRIAERDKVVSNIDAQIALLMEREKSQSGVITAQSERLILLKKSYQSSVEALYKTYVTGSFHSLLLSATTRAQIVRRCYFARIFMTVITNQAVAIEQEQKSLGVEISAINAQKEELSTLRAEGTTELRLIEKERQEAEILASTLKKDASTLIAQRAAERRALDAMQREIKRAVVDDVSGSETKNTPLSGEFAAARSRLLSPMSSARIVDTYGVHPHPTEKGVKVDNRGVNLQGKSGASVRAVFTGEVRRVFMVPGMGRSVLMRHGEFLTVYSSLDNVSVEAGDKIRGGQTIGTVGENGTLHFEIWKENQTLNPSAWVKF